MILGLLTPNRGNVVNNPTLAWWGSWVMISMSPESAVFWAGRSLSTYFFVWFVFGHQPLYCIWYINYKPCPCRLWIPSSTDHSQMNSLVWHPPVSQMKWASYIWDARFSSLPVHCERNTAGIDWGHYYHNHCYCYISSCNSSYHYHYHSDQYIIITLSL